MKRGKTFFFWDEEKRKIIARCTKASKNKLSIMTGWGIRCVTKNIWCYEIVAEQLPQPDEEYFPSLFSVIISLAETDIHHSQLYQTLFFCQATLTNLEIHVMLGVLSCSWIRIHSQWNIQTEITKLQEQIKIILITAHMHNPFQYMISTQYILTQSFDMFV